jgi:hypothetical protein
LSESRFEVEMTAASSLPAGRALRGSDGRPDQAAAGNRQKIPNMGNDVAPQSFGNPRNNTAHLHVYKGLAVVGLGAAVAIVTGLPVSVAPMPDFRPLPKLDS